MKTEKKLYFEGLRQVPIMDNNEKRFFEKTIPLEDTPDGLDPLCDEIRTDVRDKEDGFNFTKALPRFH